MVLLKKSRISASFSNDTLKFICQTSYAFFYMLKHFKLNLHEKNIVLHKNDYKVDL